MSVISASLVNELRKRTSAGMMDCKRALTQTDGDIEKAIELMRKSGQAKADKKSDCVAADGIVLIRLSPDHKKGFILEINTQTDFVARDDSFLRFANQVADLVLAHNITDLDVLLKTKMETGDTTETVEEARQHLIIKIGENIQIRRLSTLQASHDNQVINGYSHGGRMAALVELTGQAELAKDIAMHIVANKPIVVNPEQVSSDLIQKEKDIFTAQAATSGKPAAIIAKMVDGRIEKYLAEITLTGQPFLKDPEKTVGKILDSQKATVQQFVRFTVGEGIEKKTENFAEEVMAQVRGS